MAEKKEKKPTLWALLRRVEELEKRVIVLEGGALHTWIPWVERLGWAKSEFTLHGGRLTDVCRNGVPQLEGQDYLIEGCGPYQLVWTGEDLEKGDLLTGRLMLEGGEEQLW
jgi:hypothetical protein